MFGKIVTSLAFCLILFSAASVFAQTEKGTRMDLSPKPTSCEVKRIILDRAFVEFRNLEDSSFLIIITRLGSGESLRSLTFARMQDVEKFIKFRGVTDRYVLAEGSSRGKLGTSEIYVGGHLIGVIYFARNSELLCEPE